MKGFSYLISLFIFTPVSVRVIFPLYSRYFGLYPELELTGKSIGNTPENYY